MPCLGAENGVHPVSKHGGSVVDCSVILYPACQIRMVPSRASDLQTFVSKSKFDIIKLQQYKSNQNFQT